MHIHVWYQIYLTITCQFESVINQIMCVCVRAVCTNVLATLQRHQRSPASELNYSIQYNKRQIKDKSVDPSMQQRSQTSSSHFREITNVLRCRRQPCKCRATKCATRPVSHHSLQIAHAAEPAKTLLLASNGTSLLQWHCQWGEDRQAQGRSTR